MTTVQGKSKSGRSRPTLCKSITHDESAISLGIDETWSFHGAFDAMQRLFQQLHGFAGRYVALGERTITEALKAAGPFEPAAQFSGLDRPGFFRPPSSGKGPKGVGQSLVVDDAVPVEAHKQGGGADAVLALELHQLFVTQRVPARAEFAFQVRAGHEESAGEFGGGLFMVHRRGRVEHAVALCLD